MKMFSPFAFPPGRRSPAEPPGARPGAARPGPARPGDEFLNDLKRRIEEMQAQIAKLASKS